MDQGRAGGSGGPDDLATRNPRGSNPGGSEGRRPRSRSRKSKSRRSRAAKRGVRRTSPRTRQQRNEQKDAERPPAEQWKRRSEWECSECKIRNFLTNAACRRCSRPRGEDSRVIDPRRPENRKDEPEEAEAGPAAASAATGLNQPTASECAPFPPPMPLQPKAAGTVPPRMRPPSAPPPWARTRSGGRAPAEAAALPTSPLGAHPQTHPAAASSGYSSSTHGAHAPALAAADDREDPAAMREATQRAWTAVEAARSAGVPEALLQDLGTVFKKRHAAESTAAALAEHAELRRQAVVRTETAAAGAHRSRAEVAAASLTLARWQTEINQAAEALAEIDRSTPDIDRSAPEPAVAEPANRDQQAEAPHPAMLIAVEAQHRADELQHSLAAMLATLHRCSGSAEDRSAQDATAAAMAQNIYDAEAMLARHAASRAVARAAATRADCQAPARGSDPENSQTESPSSMASLDHDLPTATEVCTTAAADVADLAALQEIAAAVAAAPSGDQHAASGARLTAAAAAAQTAGGTAAPHPAAASLPADALAIDPAAPTAQAQPVLGSSRSRSRDRNRSQSHRSRSLRTQAERTPPAQQAAAAPVPWTATSPLVASPAAAVAAGSRRDITTAILREPGATSPGGTEEPPLALAATAAAD